MLDESAALIAKPIVKPGPPVKLESTFTILPIGATMMTDGTLGDEILPEYVFNAFIECEDPLHQELTTPDVTATLDAYTHYMIVAHGQPAGDKPMRVHHAKQLKARLRHLPDHQKPGAMRKWLDMLTERKRNLGRKGSGGLKVRACHTPCQHHA